MGKTKNVKRSTSKKTKKVKKIKPNQTIHQIFFNIGKGELKDIKLLLAQLIEHRS